MRMLAAALTCRSYYSLYQAVGGWEAAPGTLPQEVSRSAAVRGAVSARRWVDAAKAAGYAAVGIADVNGMAGVVDFWQAAQAAALPAVIGVEILTPATRLTLLAEDRRGYRNLCRITTARNLDEGFDVFAELTRHPAGLVCVGYDGQTVARLHAAAGTQRVFAACRDAQEAQRTRAAGWRPLAWADFNVIDEQDQQRSRVLQRIGELGNSPKQAGAGRPDAAEEYRQLVREEEFRGRFSGCRDALLNHQEVLERCRLTLPPERDYPPEAAQVQGRDADEQLARLCQVGLARRYGTVREDVLRRLEEELAVIRGNRFSDYFLVVKEIVDFARGQGIPLDVRGSAAGSLVSYVLGFTRVCPVENRLYFERFMNAGRTDCPDIDIDLCWRRRDEVIAFCYARWGQRRVAMISTLNRYRRRSAIRDAARALGIPPGQIAALVERPQRHEGSPVYRLAQELLDVPRHLGLHCGGIVIAPRAVGELAPLERAAKGVVVTQYDKDAAQAMGLIKIDLLGNRSLSTVDEAVHIVAARGGQVRIEELDASDEQTGRMLRAGESLGVFQCESPGMRQLLRGLAVASRKDVAIALSLIRPGPAAGGMKQKYIARRVKGEAFEYPHPRLEQVLADTYGVMLYQEDVMRIAVEVAGYSVAEADAFRSEVSKKVSPERLTRQYHDFVRRRARQAGIDRQAAEAIWDEILRFAAYSYCKAHAAVYGYIAWQTAYLKAHHPLAFYTALLNNHQGMYPLRVYVWDAIRHGVPVAGPHVNHSGIEWMAQGKTIRAGLRIVRGLSRATMEAIVAERGKAAFETLDNLRARVAFRRPELENLVHVGACDGLGRTRPAMLAALRRPAATRPERLLFDVYGTAALRALPDYDRVARLNAELELTGVPFTMHPGLLIRGRFTPARLLTRCAGRQVRVAGFVATARTARTNDGRVMGFVTLEDHSGLAEASFFPEQLGEYRKICRAGGPVWVAGRASEHLATVTVETQTSGTLTLCV